MLPVTSPLREQCVPAARQVDVALVLDTSCSMAEPVSSGGTKLDAAVVAQLTADRVVLDGALDKLDTGQFTCLVCGVDAGAGELASARRRTGNLPVLVLLTDGRSNPRPAAEAVALAAEAKRAGVVVFTIGLGDDLDAEALLAIASSPAFYYHAPAAEDLVANYRRVASDIPCPAAAFWGGR